MSVIRSKMTLVDLLRERACQQADARAFVFLEDGTAEAAAISYEALDQQARAFGGLIQAVSSPGDRALLLFPAGIDFLVGFFSCLYAGVVGVPAPPPEASRLKRTGPRLRAIAADAQATLVVTTSKIRDLLTHNADSSLSAMPLRWLTTDEITDYSFKDWREPALSGEPLAYLQYTSGSTSSPKGVMIGHRNLTFHLAELQHVCGYSVDSVTVTWMPNFHDYGLVEGLLEPLYNATPCYLISPYAFVKRPESWLHAITKYRATHSQAPNFAYDLCVRRIRPEALEGLDLSCWRAAGNAAELINPKVLAAFGTAFAPHGFRRSAFRPAYGLAEATLLVSSSCLNQEPAVLRLNAQALEEHRVVATVGDLESAREVAGCGSVLPAARVEIVDPASQIPCAPGGVGEIWVADPAVAQGYWRRPEETEQTFRATLADRHDGPFLRTGDLGFLEEGQLFVVGRIKDLIIIAGANHHPQDIEWTVQDSHPALRPECGAAFSVVLDGNEKLVVAQEVERAHAPHLVVEQISRVVRRAIAESHDLELFAMLLLARGSLPKTASGKIQRQACRDFFFHGGPQILGHWVARTRNSALLPAWLSAPGNPTGQAPGSVAVPSDKTEPTIERHPDKPVDAELSRRRADDLISWLREYGACRINSRLMDERRCISPHIILDFGNRGLLGMQVTEDYGGLGLRHADCLRVLEQLAAIDLTLATVVFLNATNGIRPIQHYATPGLRDEWLPRLASGRELASFALSEPGAGANVGAIATQAHPDGKGGWRLRGIKRWNSASWAGVVSVFARLVDADGRLGRLTGFLIRQGSPGLLIGPEALTMGLRASVQNSLILDDVPVGPEQVLGGLGRGMEVAEDALTVGRLCIAAVCLGGLKRCAQLIFRYGDRRIVASGRLLANPVVLETLSELTALVDALEALKNQIAARLDLLRPVPPEISMAAKVIGSDGLNWAAGQLMQLLGGRGYMENNLAPQILRDARVLSVGEGPNEPLTTQIGRKARHTRAISSYLQSDIDGSEVNAVLEGAVPEIVDRCLSQLSPLGDRSSAQLRADGHVGRLASDALLLAAIRAAHRTAPSQHVGRALAWTEHRFEHTLRRARDGSSLDLLIPNEGEIRDLVAHYGNAIGDVEQGLLGEDGELDPLLRQGTGVRCNELGDSSPGQVDVGTDDQHACRPDSRPEQIHTQLHEGKREFLARVLRQRLEGTATGLKDG
jgi:acyl-CoA synthetase (AMP-forming)/AMP-acid ligase II/alkylation response protein AidB-like acyl-CoA dehydrogenase